MFVLFEDPRVIYRDCDFAFLRGMAVYGFYTTFRVSIKTFHMAAYGVAIDLVANGGV